MSNERLVVSTMLKEKSLNLDYCNLLQHSQLLSKNEFQWSMILAHAEELWSLSRGFGENVVVVFCVEIGDEGIDRS